MTIGYDRDKEVTANDHRRLAMLNKRARPPRRSGWLPFARALRRFVRRENGATAVEFALVATPFIALLIAILETALVFFAQQVLQTATTQTSRLIMTGQAQTQNLTAAQFQQAVCN